MKLNLLHESANGVDARIWHSALLWPGTFVAIGAISPHDAREMGLRSGKLTGDEPTGDIGSLAAAMRPPHPLFVDAIEALPDDAWVEALRHQTSQMAPHLKMENIRIVDRDFDGYNMMRLKYVADVNLVDFYKSNDWSAKEAEEMLATGDFKIIKRLGPAESLLRESGPQHKTLKDNTVALTDEERKKVMSRKAVWHHGKDGAASPAIKKSVVRGKTYYWSATHRCFASATTLDGAIKEFFKTVKPSS